MRHLRIVRIYFALSTLFVVIFFINSCETEKEEIVIPDTELVKCIQEKFYNEEFSPHHDENDIGFFGVYNQWECDSTMTISIHEYSGYDFETRGSKDAYSVSLYFKGESVVLSDNENDRIAEIILDYEAKKEAIKQAKINKQQEILRQDISKICK